MQALPALRRASLATLLVLVAAPALAAPAPPPPSPADRALSRYFAAETDRLERACLSEIHTLEDWQARRTEYRRQLQDMLGLSPWPERGDLRSTVTGTIEHEQFRVEKLHFQSLPGLYVTANLYVPKGWSGKLPGILYVCGHSRVATNGVSCGRKTGYQHHGAWFARNGYVCLTIDTVHLGEIEGLHHGTYREGLWWWNARGYTPAGIETWNGIRALDYLASRAEVDPARLGVTGRSGGGAYSWFVAALDERVRVAAPVAGITDLRNHVIDGVVEGHCDCMYFGNTHRWDYPLLAALVAPRPLLLANSDKDDIFPLDGVLRTHRKVRQIYELHGAADRFGLLITEGPHRDTQDLQVPVFRWMNRWLKEDQSAIDAIAEKFFHPLDLRVFDTLPADSINTNIHELLVPRAQPMPDGLDATFQKAWLTERVAAARAQCFAGWPAQTSPLDSKLVFSSQRDGLLFRAWDFTSQPEVRLRLYALGRAGAGKPDRITLRILDAGEWTDWLAALSGAFAVELADERSALGTNQIVSDPEAWAALARSVTGNESAFWWLAPRGIGLDAWSGDAAKARQIRRRFMLLGQTLDGMRVWDIRRAVGVVQELCPAVPVALEGQGGMGVNVLYASLFESGLDRLILRELPDSHREGPDYLEVLRVWDLPDALAAALGVTSSKLTIGAGARR